MKLPIALSNRHVHLSQADIETLFGAGHELTHFKPLSQPGQYACEEKVDLVGPKTYCKGLLNQISKLNSSKYNLTNLEINII